MVINLTESKEKPDYSSANQKIMSNLFYYLLGLWVRVENEDEDEVSQINIDEFIEYFDSDEDSADDEVMEMCYSYGLVDGIFLT